MDLSQETEDYIRESIEYSLGLPVSTQTLQLKLRASEESLVRLRDQYRSLQAKLKEKDETVERARAESTMNAIALKKFVEENQRLAVECSNLLEQCKRLEKECSLYDGDREALMDFGNEADERAKEAEIRVHDLEEEVRKLSEELHFYKSQYEAQVTDDDTTMDDASVEQSLLDTFLEAMIGRDDAASTAHALLKANSGLEVCQRLLKRKQLRPSTQKVIALVAEVTILQKKNEHLTMNLHRAEKEVKVLDEENNVLEESNKTLLRLYKKKKRAPAGSGGRTSSSKGNKRKPSPDRTSPVGKLDFSEVDSPRQPLSPLRENSPEYRSPKK